MFWALRHPTSKLIAVSHGHGLAITQEDTGRVDVDGLAWVVRGVTLPLSAILCWKV